jgi:hypothetical protein
MRKEVSRWTSVGDLVPCRLLVAEEDDKDMLDDIR